MGEAGGDSIVPYSLITDASRYLKDTPVFDSPLIKLNLDTPNKQVPSLMCKHTDSTVAH